ncbi:MAG: hypothetical protein ACPLXA_14085 [Moorellaceae bacterium]
MQFEEKWNGIAWYPIFLDDEGEEITHCPGCGEWLRGCYDDRKMWRHYWSPLKREPRLAKKDFWEM